MELQVWWKEENSHLPLARTSLLKVPSAIFGSLLFFFSSLSLSLSFVEHRKTKRVVLVLILLLLVSPGFHTPGSICEFLAKWQASRYQLGPPPPAGTYMRCLLLPICSPSEDQRPIQPFAGRIRLEPCQAKKDPSKPGLHLGCLPVSALISYKGNA